MNVVLLVEPGGWRSSVARSGREGPPDWLELPVAGSPVSRSGGGRRVLLTGWNSLLLGLPQ